MSDITMCRDILCPMKNWCYRYQATPNENFQSYFSQSPRNPDSTCSQFWPDSELIILEQLKKIADGRGEKPSTN